MTEKVLKGSTPINCHIIAFAENEDEHIALAVSKNTGEVFVCRQLITAMSEWWETTQSSPRFYEWKFLEGTK